MPCEFPTINPSMLAGGVIMRVYVVLMEHAKESQHNSYSTTASLGRKRKMALVVKLLWSFIGRQQALCISQSQVWRQHRQAWFWGTKQGKLLPKLLSRARPRRIETVRAGQDLRKLTRETVNCSWVEVLRVWEESLSWASRTEPKNVKILEV